MYVVYVCMCDVCIVVYVMCVWCVHGVLCGCVCDVWYTCIVYMVCVVYVMCVVLFGNGVEIDKSKREGGIVVEIERSGERAGAAPRTQTA